MSDKIRQQPSECNHNRNHVCEHGLVDHCHYGPIYCSQCGVNLTDQMEQDLLRAYPELIRDKRYQSRLGAKTND